MLDLIMRVPAASQDAYLADPAVADAMQALGANLTDLHHMVGTLDYNNERLVLASVATDTLATVQQALADAGVPWTIIAAKRDTTQPGVDGQGNPIDVPVAVYDLAPAEADVLPYLAPTPVLDADGNVTGTTPKTSVDWSGLHCWAGRLGWPAP